MTRYVCIHGHFYQPPRESPWTGKIEEQPSASPFPNWNFRINQECYDSNSKAPILGSNGTPERYQNNYGYMSYNFGPTLLRWMDEHNPSTVKCLIDADKDSITRFGRGSAMAIRARPHKAGIERPPLRLPPPIRPRNGLCTTPPWALPERRRRGRAIRLPHLLSPTTKAGGR